MPKIKAFIKSETKENAKKCIPLVSIYINAGTPGRLQGAFAFLSVKSINCDCIVNMKKKSAKAILRMDYPQEKVEKKSIE